MRQKIDKKSTRRTTCSQSRARQSAHYLFPRSSKDSQRGQQSVFACGSQELIDVCAPSRAVRWFLRAPLNALSLTLFFVLSAHIASLLLLMCGRDVRDVRPSLCAWSAKDWLRYKTDMHAPLNQYGQSFYFIFTPDVRGSSHKILFE